MAKERVMKALKKRKKMGQCLVEAGVIKQEVLDEALVAQVKNKRKLGQILIDMRVISEMELAKVLSDQLDIPLLDLTKVTVPQSIISLVPSELAENYTIIPVEKEDKGLLVAMANPLDFYAIEDLRFATQMDIVIGVAPQSEILEAIEVFYQKMDLARAFSETPGIDEKIELIEQDKTKESNVQDLRNLSALPPTIRFVNSLFADAITQKASDIHIEPQNNKVLIRYRIDGIMREIMKIDKHIHASAISRVKVISNMDISIRRKPQDGRAQVKMGAKNYDLRVSTIPTSYGEKATLRIQDKDGAQISIDYLGLPEKDSEIFKTVLSKPQGIVLVTGPTGSGKSSTLYACLNRLNSPKVNIVSVEDPIEFDVDRINQVEINPIAGITFAAGLRSILRQDPDIIMVGEIRDKETAAIAFQAGQTGHMVLSTLHTNDAPSAFTRLLDLNIESFNISASLLAVVGQRLVRKICHECKAEDETSMQLLKRLPLQGIPENGATFYKGKGCDACHFSGYSGRTGLFELLSVTPTIKDAIRPGVSALDIKNVALREGFYPLSHDGTQKALKGITTIEEVYRVAPPDIEDTGYPGRTGPKEVDLLEAEEMNFTPLGLSNISSKRILIVDDDKVTLKLVKHFLEAENYIVLTASNGAEGLKIALQEKPDLIISDVVMPEMDGITFTRKLRAQFSTRYIPVILVTVKDDVDSEIKGIEVGADDYIIKPVQSPLLLARVNRLLCRMDN